MSLSQKYENKFNHTPFVASTYYAFQTQTQMFLAMELWTGGTLFDYLRKIHTSKFNYDIVRFYIAEIIIALEFVHAQNVMYRDLKPENILIDIDGHIKLSDFGLSKILKTRNEISETFCGSPEYLAPEMLFGRKHTRLIDFYTLGWLVYEIIVGFPPFYTGNNNDLEKKLKNEVLKFPSNILSSAKELIEWLVDKDPTKRPKEFSEVKNHIFFENLHWGKLAKREVIPPFIPSLYSIDFDKSFLSISVSKAFDSESYKTDLNLKSIYIQQNFTRDQFKSAFVDYTWIKSRPNNNSPFNPKKRNEFKRDLDPNWLGNKFNYCFITNSTLEIFDFEIHPKEEIVIQKQIKHFLKNEYQKLKPEKNRDWKVRLNTLKSDSTYMSSIIEGDKYSLQKYNERIGIIQKSMGKYILNQICNKFKEIISEQFWIEYYKENQPFFEWKRERGYEATRNFAPEPTSTFDHAKRSNHSVM